MDWAGRRPGLVAGLGRAYALSGRKDEAEILLEELQERAKSEYILSTYFAGLYASLDNADEAFRWLDQAYRERDPLMVFLRVPSSIDSLHSDPRFDKLLKHMDFPE